MRKVPNTTDGLARYRSDQTEMMRYDRAYGEGLNTLLLRDSTGYVETMGGQGRTLKQRRSELRVYAARRGYTVVSPN